MILCCFQCHLEMLKWNRANQYPWDTRTCANAASNGHLELLKWARVNGCLRDKEIYYNGKIDGDPVYMRYLEDEGCPRPMKRIVQINIYNSLFCVFPMIFSSSRYLSF